MVRKYIMGIDFYSDEDFVSKIIELGDPNIVIIDQKIRTLFDSNYIYKILFTSATTARIIGDFFIGESSSSDSNIYDFHVDNKSEVFPSDIYNSGELAFFDQNGNLIKFLVNSISGIAPNRIAELYVDIATNSDFIYLYGINNQLSVNRSESSYIWDGSIVKQTISHTIQLI